MEPYYKCIKCKNTYPFSAEIQTCPNHNPYYGYLNIEYNYSKININLQVTNSYYKYLQLLPINKIDIQIGLTKTPLIPVHNFARQYGFNTIWVKDESRNPTGSFKDRENLCAIQKALDWNIEQIFTVSSGNAAVSTAAFAQKVGIHCDCIVSNTLSVGKRFLINLYGATIIEKKLSYEQIYRWAIDSQFNGWNCTPGFNPIKEEGPKLIGYEIWEDIGVPDIIVIPCGNGTLLWSIYKSFFELQTLGFIDKLPMLIGVQVKNSSPLNKAFKTNTDFIELNNVPDSIAEGIIAQESYSSPKVMIALKNTKGFILEVAEEEIISSLIEIIKMESLIPEPTSAVVYAAVKKLQQHNNKKIVLIQTAGGSKNLKEIMKVKLQFNH